MANSNYSASLGFERAVFSTNAAYASGAYRATVTELTLKTVGGTGAPQPVLSNAGWSGNTFGFDVQTAPGQTITAVYTADCSLPLSQWQKLMTTNSTGASVHISDPNSAFMPNVYYSARNGP